MTLGIVELIVVYIEIQNCFVVISQTAIQKGEEEL